MVYRYRMTSGPDQWFPGQITSVKRKKDALYGVRFDATSATLAFQETPPTYGWQKVPNIQEGKTVARDLNQAEAAACDVASGLSNTAKLTFLATIQFMSTRRKGAAPKTSVAAGQRSDWREVVLDTASAAFLSNNSDGPTDAPPTLSLGGGRWLVCGVVTTPHKHRSVWTCRLKLADRAHRGEKLYTYVDCAESTELWDTC